MKGRLGWGRPLSITQVEERALSPGLLVPSPTELNITDRPRFVQELRALAKSMGASTVAVSLPVSCAQLAVFPFDEWPTGEEERRAVLQWRFQHDEGLAVGESLLGYRVYDASAAYGTKPNQTGRISASVSVLAAAVRKPVLDQYRAVCEEAGLLPVSIGLSTLQLCDLYRPLLSAESETFLVNWAEEGFLFMAFRAGVPVFFRRRTKHASATDGTTAVLASLQYYDDRFSHRAESDAPQQSSLYMVGTVQAGGGGSVSSTDTLPWKPTGDDMWTVFVRPAEHHVGAMTKSGSSLSVGGLCAAASMVSA
ncbi:MAG: hypothetical protein H8K08_15880 [Nitrospira sp.]|nr:hypothetical protein [Nitrospira sp.]